MVFGIVQCLLVVDLPRHAGVYAMGLYTRCVHHRIDLHFCSYFLIYVLQELRNVFILLDYLKGFVIIIMMIIIIIDLSLVPIQQKWCSWHSTD